MRALLKANAVCAQEPERAARLLVERGITSHYGYAVQALSFTGPLANRKIGATRL